MSSITGLHLQYRLWIAELNADINALRILNDYLAGITLKDNTGDAGDLIKDYSERFVDLRSRIDDLRHEMHINKMELAGILRKPRRFLRSSEKDIKHTELKKRYELFRKTFDNTKKDLHKFADKLIS
ncbi:MAG TPA: hypothetical protein VFW07_12235 [Parafilimonas sp.]|nr:hypothetical protein [Parafilimonas sp.]